MPGTSASGTTWPTKPADVTRGIRTIHVSLRWGKTGARRGDATGDRSGERGAVIPAARADGVTEPSRRSRLHDLRPVAGEELPRLRAHLGTLIEDPVPARRLEDPVARHAGPVRRRHV